MFCDKTVSLKGGFFYYIKKARYTYICFYCQKLIYRKMYYVLERDLSGTERRYHVECLEKMLNRRIKVKYLYEENEARPLLCIEKR